MKRKIGVCGAIAMTAFVLFSATHPATASAGILDIIQTTFASATLPIKENAARWSSTIFYTFVGAEFLYLLYRGMFMHDWSEIIDAWVQRLVFYGFGILVLQDQIALSDAIMTWIARIASDFALAGAGDVLTPDGLMSMGWTLSNALCSVQTWNPVVNVVNVIPQQFAALALSFAFLVVAIEDLVAQIGTQFCVAVGGISVGLMATRWTRPFASVFPRILFSTLILTVTINAVAATGALIGHEMMGLIGKMAGQTGSGILNDYITMTAAGIAYAFFAISIPALVAFLGATSPIPGGSAVMAIAASAMSYMAGKNSSGSGSGASGKSPIANIEAATRTT